MNLNSAVYLGDSVKHNQIRLFRPLAVAGRMNDYAFYTKVPEYFRNGRVKIYLESDHPLKAEVANIKVFYLDR